MKIINKKAKFNYKLLQKIEAGISLTGAETTCAKRSSVNLDKAHVKIINNETFLINSIFSSPNVTDPTRTKKLLLHKHQIISLLSEIKAKKLTLVPLRMYTKRNLVKVEIALAKGKKTYEKKQLLKDKQIKKSIQQELKENYKGDA